MAALFVVVIGGECYMRTRIDPGLSNYKQSSRVSNTIHASHLRGAGAERLGRGHAAARGTSR